MVNLSYFHQTLDPLGPTATTVLTLAYTITFEPGRLKALNVYKMSLLRDFVSQPLGRYQDLDSTGVPSHAIISHDYTL